LSVCPKDYKSIITAERCQKGTALTVDDVESVMTDHFRSLQFGQDSMQPDNGNNDNELALAMMNITCNYCKQKGHRVKDCPKLKAKNSKNGGGGKFKGTCNHCGKQGHKEADCWDKPGNQSKRPAWYGKLVAKRTETASAAIDKDDDKVEYLMAGIEYCHEVDETIEQRDNEICCASVKQAFPDSQKLLAHPNFWIADTAASVHMTAHKAGLQNMRKTEMAISLGDKSAVVLQQMGDIIGNVCNRYGDTIGKAKLTDVAVMKQGFNLFSCTKMQLQGWKLGGDGKSIWLKKGDKSFVFDIPISTKTGVVFAAYLQREIGAAGVERNAQGDVQMDYNVAHTKLGHMGEAMTRKTARALGWQITGAKTVCESCAVAKAKQASLPKVTFAQPLKKGERRVHLDISTVKPRPEKDGGTKPTMSKPQWRMVVDAESGFKSSGFYATKNGMIEPTCALFKDWKDRGYGVTHLRMDG